MDNEVSIKVKAYDETGPGFAAARRGANKTASDIEGDLKRNGPRIGGVFGGGIGGGLLDTLRKFSPQVGKDAIGGALKSLVDELPSLAQFGATAGAIMAPT